jgi:hypothetical protein
MNHPELCILKTMKLRIDLVHRINLVKRTAFMFWVFLAFSIGLTACVNESIEVEKDIQATVTLTPRLEDDNSHSALSQSEIATLKSLKQIDDYPLYTMEYLADYQDLAVTLSNFQQDFPQTSKDPWACSLFAALADSENLLFGRNFDWAYSPALLLITDPPNGYASASMVNLGFLGYRTDSVSDLEYLPIESRVDLLGSVAVPIDGFNEMGLAVGMAAVPGSSQFHSDAKPRISSLAIIRVLLDHSSTVEEAVELMAEYNIDFSNGPVVHYLIADANGTAVLVEYYHGDMHLTYNDSPWHQATNFLRVTAGESPIGKCWRYDTISDRLINSEGILLRPEALQLLQDVSQDNTQWSVLYDLTNKHIQIVMGREYDNVNDFYLDSKNN